MPRRREHFECFERNKLDFFIENHYILVIIISKNHTARSNPFSGTDEYFRRPTILCRLWELAQVYQGITELHMIVLADVTNSCDTLSPHIVQGWLSILVQYMYPVRLLLEIYSPTCDSRSPLRRQGRKPRSEVVRRTPLFPTAITISLFYVFGTGLVVTFHCDIIKCFFWGT